PKFRCYGPENSKKKSNVVCENESDNSKENSAKSLVKEQVSQVKGSFVEGCESNTSKSVNEVEPKEVRKNDGAQIIEDWVSDDEEEDEPKPKSEKKTVIPTAAKKEFVKPEKPVKKSVRLVNTAHPKTTVYSAKSKTHFSKQSQSTAKRPFYKQTTSTRRSLHKAKRHYYTRRYNAVNTAKSYTGQVNAVKKSNFFILLAHGSNPQNDDFRIWLTVDAHGHMTGISKEVGTPRYLSLVVPLTKVGDEAVHKELGDRMERAAATASSLEAEQDSGSGPRCQDTILGDVNAQTRFEITSKQSIDPPLSRGYTLGSGEDSMKLIRIDEILFTTVI
ncbi:hypothetical protein Tco_0335998, partial [Tanacetum coccineum]